jgi:hypothetical protein
MNNIKQSTENLLQGCRPSFDRDYMNGKWNYCGTNGYLCKTCKAIAKERLEMCKHFREFLENVNEIPQDAITDRMIFHNREELNLIITKLESALG